MTPAAVAAAKERHQASAELHRVGTFSIGADSFAAAIVFKPIERVLNDAGLWESKQPIRISVRKTLMPTPPERKTNVVVKGFKYLVHGELGGQNDSDLSWVIHATRKLPSPS